MRGETRRKARSRYSGDEALQRVSPRRRRERRRRERERGRAREHRAELPRMPRAVTVGVLPSGPKQGEASCAGLAPEGVYVYAERGEGRRNRPLSQGEHGCPKQSRTMSGKPARHKIGLKSNRVRSFGSSRVKGSGGFAAGKRAPRRCAPTKTAHIPLLKAARRDSYAGCGFASRIELAFGDSASLRGIRGRG